jgi:hypothetical protein
MRCTEARPLFPLYLDSAVTGVDLYALSAHINACSDCQSEYKKLEHTRMLVAALGRKPAPADLALKIKLAVSRQQSNSFRSMLRSYAVRLENTVNSFMLPATAGILTAVIFFGALMQLFVPIPVGNDDVPTNFYTPPRLESSAYTDSQLDLDSGITIETFVDATGRVENYRILSGRDDEQIRTQLNRALLFTTFEPAQVFGRRIPGRAVISFSHINVKG